MQLKLSSKGQVVLPLVARKKYHLKTGDTIQFLMLEDQMSLIPKKVKKRKGKIVIDPVTGMAAVTFGPDAPIITSEMVHKLLEDFP
jgi:AbrB family looped-hinge helix DNA binding protein